MSTLFAAVILACNEQECLPRCVESLADLAELHISVDTASTDQTEALARQYTPHVYAHSLAESNSWASCRNALQDAAEAASAHKWFLWIDPDEWVLQGRENLGRLLQQAEQLERGGIMVRMQDMPLGADPGVRGASWQNGKFFTRGQRFSRRRHEHLPTDIERAYCTEVVIGHQKLQRPEVQEAAGRIKADLQALTADWQDWHDQRAAYYVGEAFLSAQKDPETALLWFRRGMDLPDNIVGARSQLYAGLFGAHRVLEQWDEARRATHCRWAEDWHDAADCAWQLGALASDQQHFDEAEWWFNLLLKGLPPVEEGINQVLVANPVELAHWGLAVIASKRGLLTELDVHLRAAERCGARPEYADLRAKFAAHCARGATADG
jgi:hypothetical protein